MHFARGKGRQNCSSGAGEKGCSPRERRSWRSFVREGLKEQPCRGPGSGAVALVAHDSRARLVTVDPEGPVLIPVPRREVGRHRSPLDRRNSERAASAAVVAECAALIRCDLPLTRRSAWADHPGELPIFEGTVIRLQVDHLRDDRDPRPIWLWRSATDATARDVDRLWQAFLRRFDLEHTFRMLKQTLGWTAPKLREPDATDRWAWLVITAHTQLRLARPLAEDLRGPWERPARQGRLTPARGPPRISPPPRQGPSTGRCIESQHRRPRPANRHEEQAPCTRTHRRKTGPTGPHGNPQKQQSWINVKLTDGGANTA